MSSANRKQASPEEPKARPIMNFGPYPTDRNTSVEIAVWKNVIEKDDREIVTFNVTAKRSFRDDQGVWKANQNYRPHDIPVLIHALQQAYAFILEAKNPAAQEE